MAKIYHNNVEKVKEITASKFGEAVGKVNALRVCAISSLRAGASNMGLLVGAPPDQYKTNSLKFLETVITGKMIWFPPGGTSITWPRLCQITHEGTDIKGKALCLNDLSNVNMLSGDQQNVFWGGIKEALSEGIGGKSSEGSRDWVFAPGKWVLMGNIPLLHLNSYRDLLSSETTGSRIFQVHYTIPPETVREFCLAKDKLKAIKWDDQKITPSNGYSLKLKPSQIEEIVDIADQFSFENPDILASRCCDQLEAIVKGYTSFNRLKKIDEDAFRFLREDVLELVTPVHMDKEQYTIKRMLRQGKTPTEIIEKLCDDIEVHGKEEEDKQKNRIKRKVYVWRKKMLEMGVVA